MTRTISILSGLLAFMPLVGCDDAESTAADAEVTGEGGAGAASGEGGAGAAGGEGGAGAAGGEGGVGGAGGAGGGPPHETTDGVLCDLEGDGMQRLVYDQFNPRTNRRTPVDDTLPFTYAWACSGAERTLTGNGVPNHGVAGGSFATAISAQNLSVNVTLTPAVTRAVTPVREPGYALNGVKFDPATAGTCPDNATLESDCNYAMGNDSWQMVATPGETSPWRFGFGVDENDAHVQPNGQYHYHGDPVRLVEQLNPDFATSMTLVGWARDGFPIYSVYGHSESNDGGSPVVEMRSSFQLIDPPPAGRPSVEDFALGHFEQDWVYVEGSGDLDECNGRVGTTPEFPNGIYHYHITATYPTVLRCVRGTAMGGGPRP